MVKCTKCICISVQSVSGKSLWKCTKCVVKWIVMVKCKVKSVW